MRLINIIISNTTIALLLVSGTTVAQDILRLEGMRKALRGSVTSRTADKLVFNPYFSTHAAMNWGVVEYAVTKVKSVRPDIPPREDFWIRMAKHRKSADELCELAKFCKKYRLKNERLLALEAALRLDPTHAVASRDYGQFKAKKFLQHDPVANKQLATAMRALLRIEDAKARSEMAKKLIRKYGLSQKTRYFQRAYRSSKQPKGTTRERSVVLRKDQLSFKYTLFVPDSYDPFQASPLLIALHGGGKGPNGLVGSGDLALTLYSREIRNRDYIVVCPTAQAAPWAERINDRLLMNLLDEIRALFNIDENRIYLTGHSMGGYGTWHFGPKYCDTWAAIGPMSGGGSNGLKRLRDTGTFVYLFHGGNDMRVPPTDSRAAAARLLRGENDFVYTELPDTGHGLPESVVAEMFRFFDRRRLSIKKRWQVRKRSSFHRKESKDEQKYFGRLKPKS